MQKWDTETRNARADISKFEGEPCFAGLDLSTTTDFTVLTLCFERDGLYYFFHRFYIPAETASERYRAENINIGDWIGRGIVKATPGPVVDYGLIEADILADGERFQIVEFAYDGWHCNHLVDGIEDKLPRTVMLQYPQDMKQISPPTKRYERLIYEDRIVDPNPCMKWMVSNAVIKPDPNNNYKVIKKYKSSTQRVDGVISSIMAADRLMANEGESAKNADFSATLALF